MEDLIELVAASFVRHGIECPAGDSAPAPDTRPPEPTSIAGLPEHGFRKKTEGEVSP